MLHCLVFKEQLCLSKLSLQATHLLYRISFRLSRTFLFFFLSESSAPARRFQSRSIFLPGRCLAATCIILQDTQAFVNSFFKKTCKKSPASSKRALLRRDDAGFRHPFQSFSFSHSVVDPTASQRQDGFRAPISRTFRVSLCVDDDIVIGFGDLVVATRRAATLKVAHDGRTCTRAELGQRSSTLCMSAASQTTRRDRHRHGEERREEDSCPGYHSAHTLTSFSHHRQDKELCQRSQPCPDKEKTGCMNPYSLLGNIQSGPHRSARVSHQSVPWPNSSDHHCLSHKIHPSS